MRQNESQNRLRRKGLFLWGAIISPTNVMAITLLYYIIICLKGPEEHQNQWVWSCPQLHVLQVNNLIGLVTLKLKWETSPLGNMKLFSICQAYPHFTFPICISVNLSLRMRNSQWVNKISRVYFLGTKNFCYKFLLYISLYVFDYLALVWSFREADGECSVNFSANADEIGSTSRFTALM